MHSTSCDLPTDAFLLSFGAGGSVGSIVFDLMRGRSDEILDAYGTLAFGANLVLLSCLWLLWRQRHVAPPITAVGFRSMMTEAKT